MCRLIDADALGEKLEALMQKYAAAGNLNVAQDYNFVLTVIDSAPTADAAEVRRGTWDILDGHKTRRVCSACGWDVPEYGKFYSYCPNCGAKMDGGDDDDDAID